MSFPKGQLFCYGLIILFQQNTVPGGIELLLCKHTFTFLSGGTVGSGAKSTTTTTAYLLSIVAGMQ